MLVAAVYVFLSYILLFSHECYANSLSNAMNDRGISLRHHKNESNKRIISYSPVTQLDSLNALSNENHNSDPHKLAIASASVSKESIHQSEPWYTKIFPVFPNEITKFLSLSFMMFWIVFVFTMTRDTKDTLIVTNCGAEAIAFLKVYGVIPAAAGFMIVYAKLSNILSTNTLFYATLLPFFVFYALFAFVLYPLRHVLHPLHLTVPTGGLSYAVNLLRYWTFSLYYVVSELWGSAGIPLLFWSCANDIIKVHQAKRLYPLVSLIGNLGPILSGISMTMVSKYVATTIKDDDKAFEVSLKILTSAMMVAGGIIVSLHHLVRSQQSTEQKEETAAAAAVTTTAKATTTPAKVEETSVQKPKKAKPTLLQSLQFLASDRYLRNVATMVVSYGLTMEFTEIVWKASVKKAFPVKTDYLNFQGRYSTLVGVASSVMMIVGANIVKSLGWQAGALMTPLTMGILAFPFFMAMFLSGQTSHLATTKPLLIAVYVGLVQNVLSKATKYAIFDPTKEMTYIPLDHDSKTKGKAAIDVLGARLGKSGGALVQQVLVVIFGSIIRGAPVLAGLFYLVIAAWLVAVNDLAPMFRDKAATG